MTKRLLATKTTNSKGKATYTLTGHSKGKLQLQAETNDGALTSPIFTLYDCLVKDIGVKGKTSDVWQDYLLYHDTMTKSVNVKRQNDYTIVTSIQPYGRLLLDYELPPKVIIEFDCYVAPDNLTDFFISLKEDHTGAVAKNLSLSHLGIKKRFQWNHVKLDIDHNTIVVNDTYTYTTASDRIVKYFYWQAYSVNSLRFKNFAVYEGA